MGTFHILTDVIFVGSDIYQLKSAIHKNVLPCRKTDPAFVWLDSGNYSSTFYLATLSEEFDFGRKYGEQNNVYWSPPQKIIICGIEECEYTVHFSNCGTK